MTKARSPVAGVVVPIMSLWLAAASVQEAHAFGRSRPTPAPDPIPTSSPSEAGDFGRRK